MTQEEITMTKATKIDHRGEKNTFYGKKHTEESKQKMREAKLGEQSGENNNFYGRKHSEETKEKMRNYALGRPSPKKGTKLTEEQKDKVRLAKSLPVLQCDMEGNVIKEWDGVNTAGRETGFGKDCIWRCCKGKQSSAKGYIWKYKV